MDTPLRKCFDLLTNFLAPEEARKQDAERMKLERELEIKKAELRHQSKFAELRAQMEQTKLNSEREINLSYMNTRNAIIQQNNNVFQDVTPLLQLVNNDKLSESTKKATDEAIRKVYDVHMTTEQLMNYSKE